jgi:DNA invertase Pin-like site-specific DNA recombinase
MGVAYARNGDTLAVVRLDRLGRSLAELLATVTMLKERGIALLSLEEKIDTHRRGCRHLLLFPQKAAPRRQSSWYVQELC